MKNVIDMKTGESMEHAMMSNEAAEKTSSAVRRNTTALYKRDWRQNEPKGKSVYNVAQTGAGTLHTLDLIAERAKIPTWYLLIDMPEEMLGSPELSDLVRAYVKASPETRRSVLHLLKTLP